MKAVGARLQYDEILGPDESQHGFDYEEKIELEQMYSFMKANL